MLLYYIVGTQILIKTGNQLLKNELEKKGYEVLHIPNLPTIETDMPDMQKMLDSLYAHYNIDENTIIIGYSLGTLLALRIAEKTKYKKALLVACWDFNDLTKKHQLFWKNPINYEKIKQNIKEIHCISSNNDPYMTPFCGSRNEQTFKCSVHFNKRSGTLCKR